MKTGKNFPYLHSMKQLPALDLNFVRSQFPALQNDYVFMDNAGGSQALASVMDKLREWMTDYNVQLGASYEVSAVAGQKLKDATVAVAELIHAPKVEEVVIGPSTTQMLRILSLSLMKQWQPGDEVIVTNSDHEANVSCWMDLQDQGIVVKIWKVREDTLQFHLEDLDALITDRTKLVAMVHASNILGTINPIAEIAAHVHARGAQICVDGVAFAPHRLVDVQAFGVDYYVYSFYKTYGPHLAVLWGKYELLRELDGINHYFIGKDQVPYKFQPGNVNYELCYSMLGLTGYLEALYDHHYPNSESVSVRKKYVAAFELIADHEEQLANRLLGYLNGREDIRVIGNIGSAKAERVPTIAFLHEPSKSSAVVEQVDAYRIGIRFGDFYAKKLVEDLGLVEKDGVIRVSLVHYNTLEEVDRLIEAFEAVL